MSYVAVIFLCLFGLFELVIRVIGFPIVAFCVIWIDTNPSGFLDPFLFKLAGRIVDDESKLYETS